MKRDEVELRQVLPQQPLERLFVELNVLQAERAQRTGGRRRCALG